MPLTDHLRPAFSVRESALRRLALAAALLGIRAAPTRLSLFLADRIINLRYT